MTRLIILARRNTSGFANVDEKIIILEQEGDEEMLDNIVIFADGDVAAAMLLSFKLKCPMVHKAFAANIQATNKHWIGVSGIDGNGNYYRAGADRIATAKAAL